MGNMREERVKMKEKRLGLTGFGLKRLAVVSMVIDHTGSFLLRAMMIPYMVDGTLTVGGDSPAVLQKLMWARELCDILGRIAFPLFCFLMVEGFLHTHDRVKYGLRMAAFALVSEIPFNIAHYQRMFDPRLQNVMFTLAVSIFTLLLISKAEERYRERPGLRGLWVVLLTLAGAGAALFARGEYVFLGVFSAVGLYLLRDRGWLRVLGLAPLLVVSPWTLLAWPLALLYNGERGRGCQWFFYLFYPAHFLAFAGLAVWVGGMG